MLKKIINEGKERLQKPVEIIDAVKDVRNALREQFVMAAAKSGMEI